MEVDGFQVDKVYGNPDSGVIGSLIKLSTLFASPMDNEGRYLSYHSR